MKVYHYLIAVLLLPVFLLSGIANGSERFKGVDLWLPTTYQSHYTRFLEAAEKARDDPYCAKLLSGRLQEKRSSSEQLFFHFRCRSEDKQMFSLQVNGETLEVKNTFGEMKEREKKLENAMEAAQQKQLDEEEARLLAEKVAARRREQSQYWRICRKEIRKRLKSFDQVTVLTGSLPEPEVQADQLTYTVLFDAQNPARKTLHFQVICTISALDYYQVDIKPRRDKKSDTGG